MQNLESLRLAVEALGPVRRGRPVPAELRLRQIAAARDSVDAGLSKRAVAVGLGVTGETIRRWFGHPFIRQIGRIARFRLDDRFRNPA